MDCPPRIFGKSIYTSWLMLEADIPLRKPGELDGGCGHGLLTGGLGGCAGRIDGGFPSLVDEVAVDLEILADSFDDLKIDVVQGGAAGDKVLGGFLISYAQLEPLVAVEVIGNPALATFVFASNPVAEELALVGVALLLDGL